MGKTQSQSALMKVLDDAGLYVFTIVDADGNSSGEEFDDLSEAVKAGTRLARTEQRSYFLTSVIMAFVPSEEVKIIK